MRKYVIMGVQGSGKGTQASCWPRTSTWCTSRVGDIFRWNVQNHTKLGAQVRRTMAAGQLVSDDLVEGVVSERLIQHDWNYGFIIDGFPRNERQAEFFLESYDIDGVIQLDLPDSEVRRRVLARRLCSDCGMDYNLIDSSPHIEGKCDVCGGELVQGGRHRGSAGGPAARVPREDQPGARHLPAQGVRGDRGRPARARKRCSSGSGTARPAALSRRPASEAEARWPGARGDDPLMRIVLAPDSFKGSIGAAAGGAALAGGWLAGAARRPGAAAAAGRRRRGHARGPRRRCARRPLAPRRGDRPGRRAWSPARWLELPGRTHVIELARASGLPLLGRPADGRADHRHRRADRPRRWTPGRGGSWWRWAARPPPTAGPARWPPWARASWTPPAQQLPPGGGALPRLARADLTGLRPLPPDGVSCLTDVRAPLLGRAGAAAVFGPQKGADAGQVRELEAGLARLAAVLGGQPDAPGAGAAGGTGYGLAAWGADLAPGAVELARVAGLADELAGADLVITGEGSSTPPRCRARSPAWSAPPPGRRACRRRVVAGQIAAAAPPGVVRCLALADLAAGAGNRAGGGAAAALAEPARWLTVAGRKLAADLGGPAAG